MKVHKCDRCGMIYINNMHQLRKDRGTFLTVRIEGTRGPAEYELCDSCISKLEDWLYDK